MPKLEKSVLALTFKYDCDRFLRFQLASKDERQQLQLADYKEHPAGQELLAMAGRRWEADKYQDLVDVAGSTNIEHRLSVEVHPLIERHTFEPVEDIFGILRRPIPPLAIVEGKFLVPDDITPGLKEIYESYKLDQVQARPDIMWVRKAHTGAPLIGKVTTSLEYEIHIIDVKMATEPSLRHFAEVTFYALALARALEKAGLADRYAVSAEGFIWPGSHDANAFRTLYQDFQAQGMDDPLTTALLKTLLPVPYEVYQVHVKQFFDDRLLRVLPQMPLETDWHVTPKCQLCSYRGFCVTKAHNEDHLSRIARLNQGQAALLRSRGISTTQALAQAITSQNSEWQATLAISHQLRAEAKALGARAKALQTNQIEPISGRKCALMPAWSDLSIFITVHSDPGSGIAFALGATRVYFPPNREQNQPPIKDAQVFIIDRVYQMNTDTERSRLVEFVQLISSWLKEVEQENEKIRAERQARNERDREAGKLSAHIFFWDSLEVKQLKRMFERHMDNAQVIEVIDLLVRLFPPDNMLPEPELFKSQPGTVVKDVIELLFGLPIAHTYTLLEVANIFYPNTNKNGENFVYQVPFGFEATMSDQLPYERAYELWEDRIFLRKYDPRYPNQPQLWRRYSRGEIYEGIKQTLLTRLHALEHIVQKLRKHHRELLTLKKSSFSAAYPTKARIPESARKLLAFEKLNAACQEIENRQYRLLPVEEREARFISVRGLTLINSSEEIRAKIKETEPKYRSSRLLCFTFADTSRDARIKEGDFLWSISNEEAEVAQDLPWRLHLNQLSFDSAQKLLADNGLGESWLVNAPLSTLLQVEIAHLDTALMEPLIVITPARPKLFQFAEEQGLIELTKALVVDPIYQDFDTSRIEKALRVIGDEPTQTKKPRR